MSLILPPDPSLGIGELSERFGHIAEPHLPRNWKRLARDPRKYFMLGQCRCCNCACQGVIPQYVKINIAGLGNGTCNECHFYNGDYVLAHSPVGCATSDTVADCEDPNNFVGCNKCAWAKGGQAQLAINSPGCCCCSSPPGPANVCGSPYGPGLCTVLFLNWNSVDSSCAPHKGKFLLQLAGAPTDWETSDKSWLCGGSTVMTATAGSTGSLCNWPSATITLSVSSVNCSGSPTTTTSRNPNTCNSESCKWTWTGDGWSQTQTCGTSYCICCYPHVSGSEFVGQVTFTKCCYCCGT